MFRKNNFGFCFFNETGSCLSHTDFNLPHLVAKDDLELLILLSLPPCSGLRDVESQTQGAMHDRQLFYQMSHIPQLVKK